VKYAASHPASNQFSESLTAPAAEVDPRECCASSDPEALLVAPWPPAASV
jgi:hypothetical protein